MNQVEIQLIELLKFAKSVIESHLLRKSVIESHLLRKKCYRELFLSNKLEMIYKTECF